MITFTVPQEIRKWFRKRQKLFYDLFFKATSQALQETAGEKLNIRLGMLGILHTWSRKLDYHPHIHYIVPLGGLTPAGQWVTPKSDSYFLPVKLLSRKVRIHLESALRKEDPELHKKIPASIWWKSWNSDIQLVGRGDKALKYLAAYVNQSALSSKRIIKDVENVVSIRYSPSGSDQSKIMRLSGEEFIRRYMQHVLPTGFKRIRYYGWQSPAAHKQFKRIQVLLNWKPTGISFDPSDYVEPSRCQACEGRLFEVKRWYGNKSPPLGYYKAQPLYAPKSQ